MSLESIKNQLSTHYQKAKRAEIRLEKKQLETPLAEYHDELLELRGYIRGLKKAHGIVEIAGNEPELPLVGEQRL